MKTDPDLDTIIRELVEWMDGWEWCEEGHETASGDEIDKDLIHIGRVYLKPKRLKTSLDLVREIEVAVEDEGLWDKYIENRCEKFNGDGLGMKDPRTLVAETEKQEIKPRLRALRRTLREEGEV